MKRWRRRRRVEGSQFVPLTPAQVSTARAVGTRAELIVSLIYIGLATLGTLGVALLFQVSAPEGHRFLMIAAYATAGFMALCFAYAWFGGYEAASVAVLVVSTLGIVVTVSQISAGLSLESFLFGAAVMPYLLVRKGAPVLRAVLSASVLGSYLVCELAFPEGSGDAELLPDLAARVAQVDRIGAGVFLFMALGSLEIRHVRMERILEGAARYGELRATTDELTGVYNRRPVIAQLSEWARRGRGNYAIALIDLDHFKSINDEFGHDCGDTIIQAVAHTLRNHFRDSDMVSRWGGDEFLVLIPGVRHADLVPILDRLRRSINMIEKRCGLHVHRVTVSIGAAMGSIGQTPDECIATADHALYRAKEEGRNRVVAVGVTEQTHALGRPSPDELDQWTKRPQTSI